MIVKAISVLAGLIFLSRYVTAEKENNLQILKDKLCSEDDEFISNTTLKPSFNLRVLETSAEVPYLRKTIVVKPAVVPRPIYVQQEEDSEFLSNETDIATAAAKVTQMLTQLSPSIQSSQTPANSGPHYPTIDISQAYKQALAESKPMAAADPVSLGLAYQIYQDSLIKKVSEDGLSYGFRTLPTETHKPPKPEREFPEAALYAINGPILEMKPIVEHSCTDSLSTEALEDLMNTNIHDVLCNQHFVKKPSLNDLGYGPARDIPVTFVDIPPLPLVSLANQAASVDLKLSENTNTSYLPQTAEICLTETDPVHLNSRVTPPASLPQVQQSPDTLLLSKDGFKPGNVIIKESCNRKGTPKADVSHESKEEVVRHVHLPAPICGCDDTEDEFEGIRTYKNNTSRFRARNRRRNRKVKRSKL